MLHVFPASQPAIRPMAALLLAGFLTLPAAGRANNASDPVESASTRLESTPVSLEWDGGRFAAFDRSARALVQALPDTVPPPVGVPEPRIMVNGQPIWVSGTNVAWVDFARDLGPGSPRLTQFERMFKELRANGGNAVRFWMHTNGQYTPAWSGDRVTGPGANTLANLKAILDMAESYDVVMLLSLWSFDMLRATNGQTVKNRAVAILSNQERRDTYIQNALIPMVEHVKGHPAILAWEIFNEAEGMSNEFGWSLTDPHVPMADIQAFVNQTAGAIKRTDPGAQVTTGIVNTSYMSDIYTSNNPQHKNWYRDDRLKAAGGDTLGTLDFYTFHHYGHGASPFTTKAEVFELDKPVFVGEFFIKGAADGVAPEDQYQRLYDNGYAGALSWQWVDWAQSRDNNTATWPNTLLNTQYMYNRYRQAVELNLSGRPPFLEFEASHARIEQGDEVELSWRSRGTVRAELNGDSVGVMDRVRLAPDSTATYVVSVFDSLGTALRDSVTVAVIPSLEVDRLGGMPTEQAEDGTWTLADMDASYGVERVRVAAGPGASGGFELQASFDAIEWTTFHTQPESQTDGPVRTDVELDEPVHARFIRMIAPNAFTLDTLRAYGLLSDIQPPKLRITSPRAGSEFDLGSEIEITAEGIRGTTGFGQLGMKFLAADSVLGRDRFANYRYVWETDRAGEFELQVEVDTRDFPGFRSRPVPVRVLESVEKTRYEAESAARGGSVQPGSDAAASGGAYLSMSGDGSIRWDNVVVAEAGTYTARIGHYLPYDHKTQYLSVNGVVTDTVKFDVPTLKWKYEDVPIDLQAGANTIEILHYWGYMWFDYLEIRGSGQSATSIEEPGAEQASRFELAQNTPNPFNPATTIRFSLDRPQRVRLDVYNVAGERVAVLARGTRPAGAHEVVFDASRLASGVYVYRLLGESVALSRTMVLVK